MRRVPTIVAGAALVVLLAALSAPPSFAEAASATTSPDRRIVDLGTLGGPQNQSQATAINARGGPCCIWSVRGMLKRRR